MGFAITWVCLALVCATVVLIGAGRILSDSKSESSWRTWHSDVASSLAPAWCKLQLLFYRTVSLLGYTSPKIAVIEQKISDFAHERQIERDFARFADLEAHGRSNTSLDDFLRATETSEPAYVDVDGFAGTLENMYESVAERRASARARR